MDTSENGEAALVAAETIAFSTATYVMTLPVPMEIKLPIATLIGSVGGAIFTYWRVRVNIKKQKSN